MQDEHDDIWEHIVDVQDEGLHFHWEHVETEGPDELPARHEFVEAHHPQLPMFAHDEHEVALLHDDCA